MTDKTQAQFTEDLIRRSGEHAAEWSERVRAALQPEVDQPIGPMERKWCWTGDYFVEMLVVSSPVCASSESVKEIGPFSLREQDTDYWISGRLYGVRYYERYATFDAAYDAGRTYMENTGKDVSVCNVFSNSVWSWEWIDPNEDETQDDPQLPRGGGVGTKAQVAAGWRSSEA